MSQRTCIGKMFLFPLEKEATTNETVLPNVEMQKCTIPAHYQNLLLLSFTENTTILERKKD